jgi:hypothetical protein
MRTFVLTVLASLFAAVPVSAVTWSFACVAPDKNYNIAVDPVNRVVGISNPPLGLSAYLNILSHSQSPGSELFTLEEGARLSVTHPSSGESSAYLSSPKGNVTYTRCMDL